MKHKELICLAAGMVANTVFGQGETDKVAELEQRISGVHADLEQLDNNDGTNVSFLPESWPTLSYGLLVEAEHSYSKSGGVSDRDFTIATVEFVLDAEFVEGINGHIGFLFEDDFDGANSLDEAYLIFGATEKIPYHVTVGKMYLPFGNLSTVFISDPLTLELAETNEEAILAGWSNDQFNFIVGAYSGEEDSGWTAAATWTPCDNFELGGYWISNMLETDGLQDFGDALPTDEEEAGAGVFINALICGITCNAEYVTALSKINTGSGDVQPSAFNIEASAPVTEKLTLGIKYEGSDEFYADLDADKFADEQYGCVAAYAFTDNVCLATEYMHAEGLDDDEDSELVTAQLSLTF